MKRGIETFICLILLLCSSVLQAQRPQIKGTVVDEKGPLPGVNVLVKGTQSGTQTDAKGNFSMQAAQGDTLVFSSIGYATQEVSVTAAATALQIIMISETKALENVVVIGYGTKKKENLTGAVSTITSQVLQSRPITNTLAGIQGDIKGLDSIKAELAKIHTMASDMKMETVKELADSEYVFQWTRFTGTATTGDMGMPAGTLV